MYSRKRKRWNNTFVNIKQLILMAIKTVALVNEQVIIIIKYRNYEILYFELLPLVLPT